MHGFKSKYVAPGNIFFVSFTSYYLPAAIEQKTKIAFPSEKIESTLGKIVSDARMNQYRIAESEKYPHISYFFNCGHEDPFPGEERVIVKSPEVSNYAGKPEMSAQELTDKLIRAIKSKKYHFILVNYANVDSIGHSGDLIATTKAVSFVDECISRVFDAISEVDGTLIITADHGNAEQMIQTSKTNDRETFHSLSPVPFILVRSDLTGKGKGLIFGGDILSSMIAAKETLADIAPTILELLEISIPATMTGTSLLSKIIVNQGAEDE